MNRTSSVLLRSFKSASSPRGLPASLRIVRPTQCTAPRRPFSRTSWRANRQAADDPEFVSIIDGPARIVRAGNQRKFGPMLILLAIMPITAFALGTWQVQRLGWKTELIAKLEDRLIRDPLPLPPQIDPSAIHDFDYRRVYATGRLRHDQEMLVGPRLRDGQDGYMVITPLERENGSTILINRGWISKKHRSQKSRPESLVQGEVTVEGLLREPWKKNSFTPDNRPDKGEFYFPDVEQMAALTGSQPVWVEATVVPDFMRMMHYETHGIPYGRPAEVNLRNNHAHYILTWYGLSAATAIMFYIMMKKPSSDVVRRVQATR
ncbi:hypothetical protein S7711_08756 [Stachybotrys chartarum IBT 7711]|uniref:SURF1-like protein n=1 Tax=Stachybotrys chartarum (strain CBS 109288 / IBT 7711) TaxID=1280523 RepID=A0A084AJP3_STACB|nr:hypothetical protein S7711_08756 [Stachybotrys chartarum IBT 7711]KFA49736.1 hypothetical protein S40293_01460 [Stachybotrys chartarum IBT 40293]